MNAQVSKERPLAAIRCGYEGSGFTVRLVRCRSARDLAGYIRDNFRPAPGVPDADRASAFAASGFTDVRCDRVLPGVDPYACGDTVVQATVCVAAGDARGEARAWRHEITHAAEFMRSWYVDVAVASGLDEAAAAVTLARHSSEFLATAAEYMGDALDLWLAGSVEPPASLWPASMPWVGAGGVRP